MPTLLERVACCTQYEVSLQHPRSDGHHVAWVGWIMSGYMPKTKLQMMVGHQAFVLVWYVCTHGGV